MSDSSSSPSSPSRTSRFIEGAELTHRDMRQHRTPADPVLHSILCEMDARTPSAAASTAAGPATATAPTPSTVPQPFAPTMVRRARNASGSSTSSFEILGGRVGLPDDWHEQQPPRAGHATAGGAAAVRQSLEALRKAGAEPGSHAAEKARGGAGGARAALKGRLRAWTGGERRE